MKSQYLLALLIAGTGCGANPTVQIGSTGAAPIEPEPTNVAVTPSEESPAQPEAITPVSAAPVTASPSPTPTKAACSWKDFQTNGAYLGAVSSTQYQCTYAHGPHNTYSQHNLSFWADGAGTSHLGGETISKDTVRTLVDQFCELNVKINGMINYRLYDPVTNDNNELISFREIHYGADAWEDTVTCSLVHI